MKKITTFTAIVIISIFIIFSLSLSYHFEIFEKANNLEYLLEDDNHEGYFYEEGSDEQWYYLYYTLNINKW